MSKPVLDVELTMPDGQSTRIRAVFDSGSFHTLVREDRLPPSPTLARLAAVREFRTAAQGGRLRVTGSVTVVVAVGDKMIEDSALVSPDLASEMLVGAGTMQKWDISIKNRNGKTKVVIGRDMRDPEITEVD